MQITSLVPAGRWEDSSPWFIPEGFGYRGTGLWRVLAQWPGGLGLLPLLGAVPDGQAGSWPGICM